MAVLRKITGLWVDLLKFLCEKLHLSSVFHAPFLYMELYSFFKTTAELEEEVCGVVTGTVPLILLAVTSSYDATIAHIRRDTDKYLARLGRK